ncbi:MAG: BtpA/SgcQ family protein [Planctomycetota bacterium]
MPLDLRPRRPLLVGVVHLRALPGAPGFDGDLDGVIAAAEHDAAALREGGADAVIVENFGDAPFFGEAVPAETIAAMAVATARVAGVLDGLPLGVNVLRNDARAALGIAAAVGAAFLRVNVHCGAAVTDQGLLQGRASETVRERARLVPGARILADVHVKHAVPLGGGDLVDAARDTFLRGRADALVLSGRATGSAGDPRDVERVREALPDASLLVGSGVTAENAAAMLAAADGAIVGTALKREGRVSEPVDVERVRRLRGAFDAVRAR